ncbi:MAG TPA: hypothetical protein VK601_24365, partial [Kofleriaceae bacterium]|nr:hypothetical protein [Kofleriaceae bacterium]
MIALLAAAHGCTAAPPRPPGAPGPAPDGPAPGGHPGGPAGLLDGPGYNGLPARSLLSNAITQNPKALRVLVEQPLRDALFDAAVHPYLSLQLTDPRARNVMAEVVSCALDESAKVSYEEPVSHDKHVWNGHLGLCPRWSRDKPSLECLRLVSSCLFARTNRLHQRIPVRLGLPTPLFRGDRVATTTTYNASASASETMKWRKIDAFSEGWHPGYVGSCTPHQAFSLVVGQPARCRTASLRACAGIRGCERGGEATLGETEPKRGACDDAPLAFTCPAGGFFSVMTMPGAVEVVHRGPEPGHYPAPASEVFPFLEGAYFGNLFDPDGLTRSREMVLDHGVPTVKLTRLAQARDDDGDDDDGDTIPQRHIYACYSQANDQEGIAYLESRLCVKRNSKKKCFPNPPRRCHFKDAEVN